MIREAQDIVLLLKHLDGSQVLEEATLKLMLDRLATWAFIVTEAHIRYDEKRILQTLSLVVAV